MRTIILFTAFLVLGWSTASAQTAFYKVKFPNDTTIYGCGVKADTVYPIITQYPGCSFNVGVSIKDQVFNLTQNGGCKKILRTWTLLYWCAYDPNEPWPVMIQNPPDTDIGPTVFGFPSNRGHLSYVQVIKVVDQNAPVFVNCPAQDLEFCDLTGNDPAQYNDGHVDKCEGPVSLGVKVTDACSKAEIQMSYRLFLDMDGNGSMETYISSSSPNAWPIDKMTVGGDTVMASIAFPTGFGLPYGKHKIEWIANDKCGNETLCKYAFTVKDCKAPTAVCINGLSINIMQTGMITLWDTDFLQYVYDNCTPASQIKIGIRKSGTGAGFPDDSHSVTFDCSELGTQLVEVWAVDAYGNADYCETYVIVQDNMGSCPPSQKFIGKITTDDQKPVAGAQVILKKSNTIKATVLTGADGTYEIGAMTSGCNYKLLPSFDDASPKTGVNTLDALLVAGHIDNLLPLGTPYQLLAADVDDSGALSPADVLSIVKMALGVQPDFTGLPVWQFFPDGYVFPNPAQPWSNAVPAAAAFCLSGAMPAPAAGFTGVKTGDINGSAATSNFQSQQAGDRQQENAVAFQTSNQEFTAGQEVRVDIISPDLAGLVGFQFTLDYDPAVLTLVQVEPDLVPAEYIATPATGHITTSWHSTVMLDPSVIGKNIRLRTFTVVFRAERGGMLSQALSMSSAITPAEAYSRSLQTVGSKLLFKQMPVGPKEQLLMLPVRPNPVQDQVTTAYYLPEAGQTVLTLTDATGMVLQSIRAFRERGYHETSLDLKGNTQPGLLFLRLEGPGGVAVQRLMKN
ncbi:MAG: T9SS type A sorting domain-containing protein [Saprospirales bacterium]|nr:T9SS type A sorting domain-containing protein [Saprospirales bacterium]